jgi:DNA-binding IclR family transcriptional regulator
MRNISVEKPRYFVQSLTKGLRVLQIIREAGRALALSEIAEKMDANNTLTTKKVSSL